MGKTQRSRVFPKPPRTNFILFNRQKDLVLRLPFVRKALSSLLDFLDQREKELAVYFVSEKQIAWLHGKFFGDPSPTDCITFPLDETFLGEVFIAPRVAIQYATPRGIDPYQEALLYLVHGVLHLIGYRDEVPRERKKMRAMEKKCMDHLKAEGISLDPGVAR